MYVADSRGTPATPAVTAEAAAAPGAPRPGRRAALAPTVLALGTVSLITDISSEMVTAVLPLYLVAGLGLSPLGFGLLDGLYQGVGALVRLLGGHLGDRTGRHKVFAGLGYGLSALCKPLLLLAHSLPAVGAVLALDRTGKGLRTAPRDALISLASAPEERGRAFGVHRAMDTAGALIGPLAAYLVLRGAADGYDAVFTVSSCVAALGVLVLVLFVPGRPPGGPKAASGAAGDGRSSGPAADPAAGASASGPAGGGGGPGRPSLRGSLGLLRLPDLRRISLCALLLGLCTVSDAFVFLLLQRSTGLADRWFPLLPLGTAAAFFLLALPLGRLADRIGRWRVFLGGHLALLLCYGLLLAGGGHPALPYAVLLLHGAFYAATDGVLMAAASATVPDEHRGSGLALVQTGQALARFCCSLAFGAAWTAWGPRPALAVAGVLLAVAAAAATALRPADA
ncbi:MFS transporter [Streptomyces sp. WAC06614]|uniref:MFS transporter n=1 Tax=Streptomyces sp. WAC06614 TaxID=2487416 RepID=UPI000F799534|nr:MFS transporter [Streptomyces sp. WAC06614]RSS83304.1 MFS transporter [Streptomyces sp. WAC06614]